MDTEFGRIAGFTRVLRGRAVAPAEGNAARDKLVTAIAVLRRSRVLSPSRDLAGGRPAESSSSAWA
jgi:hypothetical protein